MFFADVEFRRAMADSNNLIEIHKDLNQGPGRRIREVSINRAVVVLTVAAWQAFVQDLILEVVDEVEVERGMDGYERYRLMKIDAKRGAHFFSTPNAENTRNLLMTVGFDPWRYWSWTEGPRSVNATLARERMNQWLQVRHAIAHGDDELPDVRVLTATDGRRSITRDNAEACMKFFTRVVDVTTEAAEAEFGDPEDD